MALSNKFKVGEIVTFKTHPLLYDLKIKGDGKLVPPFMVVVEIFFESKKKKIVDDKTGNIIAHRIKYNCVFFDDNNSQFKEVMVYEPMLMNYKSIFIARADKNKKDKEEGYKSLIQEAKNYKNPKYKFGKIVYFKTKKFEIFKKRSSKQIISQTKKGKSKETTKEITLYVVNYSTPDFLLSGFKKENLESLFYPSGEKKKLCSDTLVKVKWFNHKQLKFSEKFLPIECFIDEQPFKTKTSHSSSEEE